MTDVVGHNRWLHRVALVVTWATLPLLVLGALVTSKDAGMSVPDWPRTYGYNMFLFPPRLWQGNIFWEHTHRLYASLIGLLTIALAACAWFTERRRWVRWLGVACLGMVILQGVLGGLRVVLIKLNLAIVHACVAQAFFCLLMLVCLATSRWWGAAEAGRDASGRAGRGLVRLAVLACVVIYAQLIIGAMMRHNKAGLAIPDLPLAYGRLIPPTGVAALEAAQDRGPAAWSDLREGYYSMSQVWMAFGHRVGAVLVTAVVTGLAATVLSRHARAGLVGPAWALLGLLVVQVTLGVLTVLYLKPADVASAHVAVGALVLVTAFVVAVRAMRLYLPYTPSVVGRGFEVVGTVGHGPQAGRLNEMVG